VQPDNLSSNRRRFSPEFGLGSDRNMDSRGGQLLSEAAREAGVRCHTCNVSEKVLRAHLFTDKIG
jgi:hypothetical protein